MAFAMLLGGFSGLFLKNIIKSSTGIVMTVAYQKSNPLTSSIVLTSFLIMKPGRAAPIVIESKLKLIPVKATKFTAEDLNQLIATLLGLLRMKILPIAAKADPNRQ